MKNKKDDTITSVIKEVDKMAKSTEAHIRANIKHAKENVRRIAIGFNKNTDKDILEKLESVGNKQGYIKKLIREDIAKENKCLTRD